MKLPDWLVAVVTAVTMFVLIGVLLAFAVNTFGAWGLLFSVIICAIVAVGLLSYDRYKKGGGK